MDESMEIAYLAGHPEFVPTLAGWFHQQWSYLYPERSLEDVATALRERTGKDRLPLALVVLENKQLLGTVSLKIHDMDTRMQWSPWLAALLVKRECRRAGLGSLLVRAIENQAAALGVRHLYLYTPESEGFYAARGWQVLERTRYHDYPVTVMEKELGQREGSLA